MAESKVLRENMQDVNRLLLKVSGLGISILYGLSFLLYFSGYLDISMTHLIVAALSSYILYFATLILYRIPTVRHYFHYLFPLELYLTVAIGIYFFQAPISAYPIWLIPIIYAGMYAHRGSMLLTTLLVLVTGPIEVLFASGSQTAWADIIKDVAIASIVMLILSLRMISLVNRSRVMIARTEGQMEENMRLQRENERLMQEVAAATEEMGVVVEKLTLMAHGTREAMVQVAKGGEEIIVSSHRSKQVLLENQQVVEEQVATSEKIGLATRQAVIHAHDVRGQATTGENVVEEIADVIFSIDRQSVETTEKVARLTERTMEITSINQSIASIAKNVTIVAINASIEAARAGAAGRTFHVVAEQVQELAGQTAQAAEEIEKLAERIQSDLLLIHDDLRKSSTVVKQGVSVSEEAKSKLRTIHQAVEEVHLLLQTVDRDAQCQLSAAGKIAAGISLLREQTEQNVFSIETAAAGTEETAAIMDDFLGFIDRLHERAETLTRLIAEYSRRKS